MNGFEIYLNRGSLRGQHANKLEFQLYLITNLYRHSGEFGKQIIPLPKSIIYRSGVQ